MKNFVYPIRFVCLIFILMFVLSSCSPVYEHMPETTDSETKNDPTEEYFTTGEVVCGAAGNLGVAYEGQWVYVESARICIREDNPNTPVEDAQWKTVERLVKYNPVTKTVSSLCLEPTCLHSTDECLFCAPHTWMVSYFEIFGDWIMYSFANYFAEPEEWDVTRNYLYNLKTGESHQLHSDSKEGELLGHTTTSYVMNGKVYSTLLQLDYTGKEEWKALNPVGEFVPETHQYVEVYDPATQKLERLCEIPEDMFMIGLTNKRLMFRKSDQTYWSSDYNGENMSEEKTINFDLMMVCGKYAYLAGEDPDYTKLGYNYRGYDLETDSIFHVDFGCQIRNILVDSGKLVYTTFTKIDEFKEFVKNKNEYVKNMYPDITKPEEIVRIQNKISNSFQYDGTFQIYVTDALGNNKQLVFEGENMNISPLRISGNYLYGYVSYGDPNNDFEVTYPGDGGRCALNLETGEITLIPQLEIFLDSQ